MVVDELSCRAAPSTASTTDGSGCWAGRWAGTARSASPPTSARSGSRPWSRSARRSGATPPRRAAGFEDAEEYEQYSVMDRQDELGGIPVRVDCGTGDPFYREVEATSTASPPTRTLTSTFEPGGHDGGVLAPDAARRAGVPRAPAGTRRLTGERPGVPDRRARRRRRRLPRRLGPAARGARARSPPASGPTPCCCSSTRRSTPPASAPSRTSGRSTPAAHRSSRSTAAARSPSTAPASWSATRSSRCPTTSRSSTTYAASRRR